MTDEELRKRIVEIMRAIRPYLIELKKLQDELEKRQKGRRKVK